MNFKVRYTPNGSVRANHMKHTLRVLSAMKQKKQFVRALVSRDIPTVQAAALLFGLLYGVVGLVLDAACAAIDPRRRLRVHPA